MENQSTKISSYGVFSVLVGSLILLTPIRAKHVQVIIILLLLSF